MSWLSGQKMQAARITEWKTPYKLQQIDVPQPGEYELLLKTKAAGYCHTDAMVCALLILHSHLKSNRARYVIVQVQEGKSPLGASTPITGSHEPAGVVVAMGSKAKALGFFKEGSRVCGGLMVGTCGACVDCREFGVNYCRNMEG